MLGDTTIRVSTEIIAEPRRLLAEIDALFIGQEEGGAVVLTLTALRNLVLRSVQTEYVQIKVSEQQMTQFGEEGILAYVTEKLHQDLGARLVEVTNPVITRRFDTFN